MRALLPFIRLFKFAKLPLIFGGLLMILGLASSIGLLTLSGWFLAATAIAGLGSLFNFFYPSASVRGLAIGRTVARYFEKVVTHDATFRVLAKLRVQVFSKIIPLSPGVLNRYRNSDLLNRLVADVDTLDGLYLRLIAPFISAIVVITLITLGLSFVHVPLALFLGLTLLTLLLVIPTIFYHLGNKFGAKLTQSRALYRTQFVEFIQAQAELLLFNGEEKLKDKLSQTEQQWQAYQQQEANLSGFSTALLFSVSASAAIDALNFSSPQQEDDYHALTQELRCPQCQNNNIADSNAVIAVDMRGKVFELLQEGKSKQDVVQYMVDRYGNFVTYDPPLTPATMILWCAPILFILLGVLVLFRRKRSQSEQVSHATESATNVLTEEQQNRLNTLLSKENDR